MIDANFFTSFEPDPFGVIIGSDYMRFTTAIGIDGLAKLDDKNGLDVLAVISHDERTGQFRRFIAAAQDNFRRVGVWDVMNPVVSEALKRYGFSRATYVESDGEVVEGWQWIRESA